MKELTTKKAETAARKYVRAAFLDLCGFAPAMKDIDVLYGLYYDDGTTQYVSFAVGDHLFGYDGVTVEPH